MKKISDRGYVAAAKRLYDEEGTLEFDDNAVVSKAEGENGAYVQCWRWVYDDDVTPHEARLNDKQYVRSVNSRIKGGKPIK